MNHLHSQIDPPASAVILLSGGLDSATCLAIAKSKGYACHALSFDYGQRHLAELAAARRVADRTGVITHKVVRLDLADLCHSALTVDAIPIPRQPIRGIPITYVPARNTIFLAIALGWAETLGGTDIFIGVNAVDYSGYPDCRPAFISAFQTAANLGTRTGVDGQGIKIRAPLIGMSKAEIIREGQALGVDFADTISCYRFDAAGAPCGVCDACRLRRAGFAAIGIADPGQPGSGKH